MSEHEGRGVMRTPESVAWEALGLSGAVEITDRRFKAIVDLIRAHDAEVAAQAWDEGHAVGEDNFIHSDYCGTRGCQCQGVHGTTNPYLTEDDS